MSERWPTWAQFLTLVDSPLPVGKGTKVRLLNAVQEFRQDNPDGTVADAFDKRGRAIRRQRNVGRAIVDYAMNLVLAWRRDTTETPRPRMIVAEVSKQYDAGVTPTDTISMRFERVIAVNEARGYRLRDWKLATVAPERSTIYETIVAIFEDART